MKVEDPSLPGQNAFLEKVSRRIWSRMNLSELTRRRMSAFLYGALGPALVQPPVMRFRGEWQTWVRVDIIRFLDEWGPRMGGRVLDVGGGTWTYPRQTLAKKCDYLLVDCLEHPNVDVVGDIHRLTELFECDSFDWLLCCDVLEHVADPGCVAREMHAILKPGGRLLLTTPFNFHIHSTNDVPDLWRITEQGLRRILGMFSEVEVEARGSARFPRSYRVVATK